MPVTVKVQYNEAEDILVLDVFNEHGVSIRQRHPAIGSTAEELANMMEAERAEMEALEEIRIAKESANDKDKATKKAQMSELIAAAEALLIS